MSPMNKRPSINTPQSVSTIIISRL